MGHSTTAVAFFLFRGEGLAVVLLLVFLAMPVLGVVYSLMDAIQSGRPPGKETPKTSIGRRLATELRSNLLLSFWCLMAGCLLIVMGGVVILATIAEDSHQRLLIPRAMLVIATGIALGFYGERQIRQERGRRPLRRGLPPSRKE